MTTRLIVAASWALAIASIPIDGLPGIGLAAAGAVLGVVGWRRIKRERGGSR